MARGQSTAILDQLIALFPTRWLRRKARETGAVKRLRKVDPVTLVWTLVFGFGVAGERSLAGLRRLFEFQSGRRIAPSAFYQRFSPQLAALLRQLLEHAFEQMAEKHRALKGRLAAFKDLVAADATVIRLADLLERSFPACRTNHTRAAAKIHAVMSVVASGLQQVRITSERVNDGQKLVIGPWVKDKLLLIDLGFYRFQLFSRIRRNGGYFVSRMKENANPLIVDGPFAGQLLQDVQLKLRRKSLDVEVALKFKRRTYRDRRRNSSERFRLVAVRNSETGRYHVYITNVVAEVLTAEEIAEVYRLRWEIELLFKELKGSYRLADMPSGKGPIVLALLYASMLSLVASRTLLRALVGRFRRKGERARIGTGRWGKVLRTYALDLLGRLLRRAGGRTGAGGLPNLEAALFFEAIDPNVNRGSLFSRTEAALASAIAA